MKLPMRGSAVALLFVLLGCASGGASKQESATAPGTDLAAYATFGWRPAAQNPDAATPPLSILDANIQNAIRSKLIEKGYREVESAPDFEIGFETSSYVAEKVKDSPVRIGVGMGSWGGNVGGGVSTSMPVGSPSVVTAQETRITIQAVDPKGNREVWLGSTAGKTLEAADAGAVEKAVAAAMRKFPARRK